MGCRPGNWRQPRFAFASMCGYPPPLFRSYTQNSPTLSRGPTGEGPSGAFQNRAPNDRRLGSTPDCAATDGVRQCRGASDPLSPSSASTDRRFEHVAVRRPTPARAGCTNRVSTFPEPSAPADPFRTRHRPTRLSRPPSAPAPCVPCQQTPGLWRLARSVHDPGKTVLDLAVTIALGGDAWLMPRWCATSRVVRHARVGVTAHQHRAN